MPTDQSLTSVMQPAYLNCPGKLEHEEQNNVLQKMLLKKNNLSWAQL